MKTRYYLRLFRTVRGDSVEYRITGYGPDERERVPYSTGWWPLPDGCMAMQLSIPAMRDLSSPGYPLLAVTEEHYYDDNCIADEKADTTWTTFLDMAHDFRPVFKVTGDLFRVQSANNRLSSDGGEMWDNRTVADRRTIFRTDRRGLHVTVRDQIDPAQNVDYLMVWNSDSTKLVRVAQ